ncbi:putative membrane protein [Colwellia chukchiensis]|uniref:Putative membrane protein n=1 Tax=Colwellia chukchiensis TaxID=641665 RepID=A0A1H7MI28_9GAMM|nr:lipopolysaccharide assembly protein LapA domain-containing protein [Colwellia chukchiensis]SEL10893.1 putative membrane protein [Colwellia chukchiensis]
MRLYITVILFLVLLAIAFIFGTQNDQVMTLNYLIAKTSIPVAVAVGLFTAIGFVMGLLFVLFWWLLRKIKPTKSEPSVTGKKS